MRNFLDMRLFTTACVLFLGFSVTFANAQSTERTPEQQAQIDETIARSGIPSESIAAVVNDKVITTFDVRQRMRLMLLSSGGRIPAEALPQLQQQAMRDLIEEKLKLQEAKKFELEVADKEVQTELTMMAAQSNLTLEQFTGSLEQAGVSVNALKGQIESGIIWPELVQGRFRDRVRISEDEVEDTLERMRDDASKEQFLVSEICIPVDDPSQAQQYYQGGLQLIEQMRRGVPFAVIAQQFSACTTAAVGGDMGWVRSGELPPEIDTAIRDLSPGSVTNPIPSEGAFMILAVRDKREPVIAGEPTFTLAYASIDAEKGRNEATRVLEELPTSEACSGGQLRIDLGEGVGFALLENMTLDKIDEDFRPIIEDLQRGDTSAIVEVEGAFHGAYVCDLDEGLGLPSRDSIENRIYGRQLGRIGQQYLRNLERESAVDIRLDRPIDPNG